MDPIQEVNAGPDPAELDLMAILADKNTPLKVKHQVRAHLQIRDLEDPIHRLLFTAVMDCAVDGESAEGLLLDRLRAGGHLQRDVDGRIGVRLSQLVTRPVDILQAQALVVTVLDRAEARLIASHAHMADEVSVMPPEARREAMRAYWTAYRDITERMDAAGARIGEPAGRPNLQAVSA